jgi:hypothetical protein
MMAFHVPEANYRAFGYESDFDSLPWQESYDARSSQQSQISAVSHAIANDGARH